MKDFQDAIDKLRQAADEYCEEPEHAEGLLQTVQGVIGEVLPVLERSRKRMEEIEKLEETNFLLQAQVQSWEILMTTAAKPWGEALGAAKEEAGDDDK